MSQEYTDSNGNKYYRDGDTVKEYNANGGYVGSRSVNNVNDSATRGTMQNERYNETGSFTGSSNSSGNSCFVATAVYHDVQAPQVVCLRKLRDNHLRRCHLGRKFINYYYSGAGKAAAKKIETQYKVLIPFIRAGLNVVVKSYSLLFLSKKR